MKNNKKRAFTLAETLIVLMVMGFLVTAINAGYQSIEVAHRKRIYVEGRSFYTNLEGVLQDLMSNTFHGDMTALTESDTAGTIDSKDLRTHIVNKMSGTVLGNCNSLPMRDDSPVKSYTSSAACAKFDSGVIAAFFYNARCDSTVRTMEYLPDEGVNMDRNVANSCGYVVYGFKNSSGVYGKDIFVIPLGKTRFN